MSLDNLVEKSEKKNDQDQVDGKEAGSLAYSKGKDMHNEMANIYCYCYKSEQELSYRKQIARQLHKH